MHAPRIRVQRRPVHGVLLLDKPLGMSSNQALQRAKWLLRADKAGHTGTLDPQASGILPLCFGAATKFSHFQLEADKVYLTQLRLGQTTTTADAEGELVQERPVQVGTAQLRTVLQRFTGDILQVPPMHSAIKKDGKPLYAYARSGAEVEREARPVRIYALEPTENRSDPADPLLGLIVRCSKGTYVRTLGEDIGAALGCGAHLASLRRIATGHLQLADAITLEALEAMDEVQRLRCLLPVERLFVPLPRIVLDGEHSERFAQGLSRRGRWSDAPCVAVFGPSPQALLGLGSVAAGVLQPSRLLSADDREQMQQQQSALASAGAPTESPHP